MPIKAMAMLLLTTIVEIAPSGWPTSETHCEARLSDVYEGRNTDQGNMAPLLECWRARYITYDQFTRATTIMFPRE